MIVLEINLPYKLNSPLNTNGSGGMDRSEKKPVQKSLKEQQ